MILFFIIIGCIVAFLLFFWFGFLWFYQKRLEFRFVIDKRKITYNFFEKFLDSFYGSLYKKVHELIVRNQSKKFKRLLCVKCQAEKESLKLAKNDDQQSKLNQHIIVEYYLSNRKSWRDLCGREGYFFKCSKHNIVVYDMVICRS